MEIQLRGGPMSDFENGFSLRCDGLDYKSNAPDLFAMDNSVRISDDLLEA
jgi:hypothetical protein